MSFADDIKKSVNGDEYYTRQEAVNLILPYIFKNGFRSVWCPFDTEDSNYVKTFKMVGLNVVYGHIETGQDFFSYDEPQAECIVSNPPFSKRNEILAKLYGWNIPFALILYFNGLFDAELRWSLCKENGVELLIPNGRMRFNHRDKGELNSPNFQSIYVCYKMLGGEKIVFDDYVKFGKVKEHDNE